MKRCCLCFAIIWAASICLSVAEKTEDAFSILSHADQLESSMLGEGGEPSKLTPMFAILAESEKHQQQFQRLATQAATNAGKAYGILGLYMSQPDPALERAKSLPGDFKVRYMFFCIVGEWGREEFVEQLQNGNLLRAVSYPVRK